MSSLSTPPLPPGVSMSDLVAAVQRDGGGVVALESTIFSLLGLPAPHNADAYRRCVAAVERAGATAALTAVIDGVARIGCTDDDVERICHSDRKVSERDLGIAVGGGWPVGVTTVAASVSMAAAAGIAVFATGGIGGVHRGAELSGDVSADLGALARHPVVTVTAGAKAFLDLPRTVEYLDTLSVPLIGFQTDEFPAFYSRSSGVAVPHRVDTVDELAAVVRGCRAVGYGGGIVVANPIPSAAEIPADDILPAIDAALASAAAEGITSAAVTPHVLAHMAEVTDGRSIPANLALAESNAQLAGELATALAT